MNGIPSGADLRHRLALMVIADPAAVAGHSIVDVVRAALAAGAPSIQLRAKTQTARETVELGRQLVQETRRHGALFVVNDRVDIALVVEADGAHIGDDDLPLAETRAIVPRNFVLGRSVTTVEGARAAAAHGADYLGAGPIYATLSKGDAAQPIGPAGMREIVAATALPVVGIGGIDMENAAEVMDTGAAGVSVIRAVMGAPSPRAAVEQLLSAIRRP
jgi:thiamine-phosphate pyrophosphorylase